jgi:hypothetical protein
MNEIQDPPVADEKKIDFKVDLNEKLDESMGNGFDAIGKIFGGIIGAIKDAVGPEMMKALGAAAQCLEAISKSLSTDGTVPGEPNGQLSFLKDQLDKSLDGTNLEAQKATFQQYLQNSQQALENAAADPQAAAKTLAHAAGYFKAAATSFVPVQPTADSDNG